MKITTTLVACALFAATEASSVAAQATEDLYYAVFQPGVSSPSWAFGLDDEEFLELDAELSPGLWSLEAVESYWDDAGVLRHDAKYAFFFGELPDSTLFVDVAEADLNDLAVAQASSGRQIHDVSSRLDADGVRRYTVVMHETSEAAAATPVTTGQSISAFNASLTDYAALGFFPAAVERSFGSDGKLKTTAAWRATGAQEAFGNGGIDASEMLAEIAAKKAEGKAVRWLSVHRAQSSGIARFAAGFDESSQASAQSVRFGLTQQGLQDALSDEFQAGNRLVALGMLTAVTEAEGQSYGTGLTGTNGVPELTLSDDPYLGQSIDIRLGNESGVDALSALFIGLTSADIPFKGGSLLVTPFSNIQLVVPSAGLDLPIVVPSDPLLDGFELFLQLVQQDAGAVKGLALSQGLEMTFGHLD